VKEDLLDRVEPELAKCVAVRRLSAHNRAFQKGFRVFSEPAKESDDAIFDLSSMKRRIAWTF
jgi:hypothetical protein